jgi:predicted HTH transcriptional regulator
MTLFDPDIFNLKRDILNKYENRKSIEDFKITVLEGFQTKLRNVRFNSLEINRDNKKIIIVQILENNYSGLYIDKVKYYYGGRI